MWRDAVLTNLENEIIDLEIKRDRLNAEIAALEEEYRRQRVVSERMYLRELDQLIDAEA